MGYAEEKKEFVEQMIESVLQIPTSHVIGKRISLKPGGKHMYGLCPFHGGHMGSFVVTDHKGLYKCFCCDAGGNSISFVSKYENKRYLEAAFDVALEEGVITHAQYQKYSKKRYEKEFVKALIVKHENKQKVEEKEIDPVMADKVYTFIKNFAGLSEEHREKLKNERKLSDKRIDADYFTFPNTRKYKLIKALKAEFPEYTTEQLMDIPGFFYNRERSELTYAGYQGIGILIRGVNGMVRAIQIRRDVVKEGESRYVWFSSSFAQYDQEKYKGGNGCGSPKDILFPQKSKNHYSLAITEGRFKSEILAKNGSFAISVQGVSSWKGIEEDIKAILEFKTLGINSIYIFYDADMLSNVAVFSQAMKLGKHLQNTFPTLNVVYVSWHESLGKGIDDLYNNGHIDDVRYLSADIEKVQECILEGLLSYYGASEIKDVPEKKKEEFGALFQRTMEAALL